MNFEDMHVCMICIVSELHAPLVALMASSSSISHARCLDESNAYTSHSDACVFASGRRCMLELRASPLTGRCWCWRVYRIPDCVFACLMLVARLTRCSTARFEYRFASSCRILGTHPFTTRSRLHFNLLLLGLSQ